MNKTLKWVLIGLGIALVVFFIAQKQLIEGIARGGIKG